MQVLLSGVLLARRLSGVTEGLCAIRQIPSDCRGRVSFSSPALKGQLFTPLPDEFQPQGVLVASKKALFVCVPSLWLPLMWKPFQSPCWLWRPPLFCLPICFHPPDPCSSVGGLGAPLGLLEFCISSSVTFK